jgi:hypothetical protein
MGGLSSRRKGEKRCVNGWFCRSSFLGFSPPRRLGRTNPPRGVRRGWKTPFDLAVENSHEDMAHLFRHTSPGVERTSVPRNAPPPSPNEPEPVASPPLPILSLPVAATPEARETRDMEDPRDYIPAKNAPSVPLHKPVEVPSPHQEVVATDTAFRRAVIASGPEKVETLLRQNRGWFTHGIGNSAGPRCTGPWNASTTTQLNCCCSGGPTSTQKRCMGGRPCGWPERTATAGSSTCSSIAAPRNDRDGWAQSARGFTRMFLKDTLLLGSWAWIAKVPLERSEPRERLSSFSLSFSS